MKVIEMAQVEKEINVQQKWIKEYTNKRNSLKNEKKKLTSKIEIAKENKLHFKEKEKYQNIQQKSNSAKVCLSNAQSNISSAYTSYNNNFQGNAASIKLSTFTNSNSRIRTLKEKLNKIYDEASVRIKKLNQKISSNNASIGVLTSSVADCDKAITKFKNTQANITKKIIEYNKKIREKERYIARLRGSLR